MKYISEERLTQLLGEAYAEYEELFIYNLLNTECVELNPWQPMTGQACAWNNIESAPKGRPVLYYYPTQPEGRKKMVTTRVCWDSAVHKPTHWQELPPDPPCLVEHPL